MKGLRGQTRAFGLEKSAARQSSAQQTGTAVLRTRSSLGALVFWSLIGPMAVAGIGAAAFAWPSPHGHAVRFTIARWVQEGLLTSSVWLERLERLARPARSDADVTGAGPLQPSSVAQTMPQQVAPAAAQLLPQLSKRLQTSMRELTNVQQAIEQLKASQAQLAHDNAGLAERVKETQEQIARQTGQIANDLNQARSEMMRGSADIAAQLKASQEQMAGISQQLKATQEQMTHLGATERQPRPSIDISRRKSGPTPASQQVRVRP
jgi:gas vesicle protein